MHCYGSTRWFFLVMAFLSLSEAQPKSANLETDQTILQGVWSGIAVSEAYNEPTFTSEASLFAAVTQEGVTVWGVSKGEKLHTLSGSKHADALALSPNGEFLAARDGTALRIVSVSTGKVLSDARVPGPHTNLFLLHFSPDGTHLAVSEGNRARLFKVAKDGHLARLPLPIEHAAYDANFSPDNRFVLATDAEGVHLRRVSDGSPVRRYTRPNDFTRASFGPDNTVYLSGQKSVQHRSLEGRVLRTFRPKEYVYEHTVSPDGRLLATGGYEVQVWEVASGKLVATLGGEPGAAYAMAFSEDSSALYTASEYGAVIRYALPSEAPELLFRAEDVRVTLDLEATYLTRHSYKVSGTFRFGDEPPLPVNGTLPTADALELTQGEIFCALPMNIGKGRAAWSVCGFPLPSSSSPPVRVFDAIRYTFSSDEEADLAFEGGTEDEYEEAYWFVLRRRE